MRYPIEQVCEIVDTYRPLLEDLSASNVSVFSGICEAINHKQFFDQAIEYLQATNPMKLKMLELKYRNLESTIINSLGYIKIKYEDRISDFINVLNVIKNIPESMNIFTYITDYFRLNGVVNRIEATREVISFVSCNTRRVSKNSERRELSQTEEYDNIKFQLDMVLDFIHSQEAEAKRIDKKKNSDYYSLKNAMYF
jgi:hypothetical protein